MSHWGSAYPRISRWLGSGLRELEMAADLDYPKGPDGVEVKMAPPAMRTRTRRAVLPLYLVRYGVRFLLAFSRVIGPVARQVLPGVSPRIVMLRRMSIAFAHRSDVELA
jgi:hypothetical protein